MAGDSENAKKDIKKELRMVKDCYMSRIERKVQYNNLRCVSGDEGYYWQ